MAEDFVDRTFDVDVPVVGGKAQAGQSGWLEYKTECPCRCLLFVEIGIATRLTGDPKNGIEECVAACGGVERVEPDGVECLYAVGLGLRRSTRVLNGDARQQIRVTGINYRKAPAFIGRKQLRNIRARMALP